MWAEGDATIGAGSKRDTQRKGWGDRGLGDDRLSIVEVTIVAVHDKGGMRDIRGCEMFLGINRLEAWGSVALNMNSDKEGNGIYHEEQKAKCISGLTSVDVPGRSVWGSCQILSLVMKRFGEDLAPRSIGSPVVKTQSFLREMRW